MDFALPFTDFAPSTIPIVFNLKAEEELALRVRLPPQSALDAVFSALNQCTNFEQFMNQSFVLVRQACPEIAEMVA